MIEGLQINLIDIIIIISAILLMAFAWKHGKKETVKTIIYGLVCQAEQMYGSNTGPVKLATVWIGIYEKLPWIIRVVFPRKVLEGYIKEALLLLKQQLKCKEFNLLTYNQELESVIKDKVSFPNKSIR